MCRALFALSMQYWFQFIYLAQTQCYQSVIPTLQDEVGLPGVSFVQTGDSYFHSRFCANRLLHLLYLYLHRIFTPASQDDPAVFLLKYISIGLS